MKTIDRETTIEVYIQILHGRKTHLLTCYLLFIRHDKFLINIVDV